jgi:hypothetical protein
VLLRKTGTSVVKVGLDRKSRVGVPLLEGEEARAPGSMRRRYRQVSGLNNWQIKETVKALAEADHGEFASNRDVRRTLEK